MLRSLIYPIKVWQEDKIIYVSRLYRKTFYRDVDRVFGDVAMNKMPIFTFVKPLFFESFFTLSFHYFFAPEVYKLFKIMYEKTKRSVYLDCMDLMERETWLKASTQNNVDIDISKLNNELKYELKPYQKGFINNYFNSKLKMQLRGALMAFEQGLGKTFTALATSVIIGKQTVIFCPKSLVPVWQSEIKNLFKKEKSYVVVGSGKELTNKNYDFIICNYEKADAANNFVTRDVTIIIDECHNIRYLDTNRVSSMVTFREITKCKDVIPLSGTPVKALASELIPIMRMLDPKFDNAAMGMFSTLYRRYSNFAYSLLLYRLTFMMDRKVKEEVLQLPAKIEQDLFLNLDDENPYLIDTIKKDIAEYAEKRLVEIKQGRENYITDFKYGLKICLKNEVINEDDYDFLMDCIERISGSNLYKFIISRDIERFRPLYDKCLRHLRKHYPDTAKTFVTAKKSTMSDFQRAMGEAMGKIFIGRRIEAVIKMTEQNIDKLVEIIKGAEKKTIIFSNNVEPLNVVNDLLNKKGIGSVTITDDSNDIRDTINKFKTYDNIDVLCGTIGKMSTGHTLVVANVVIFLDMPYRAADYKQAQDRAHRIGQDTTVFIYKILLDTGDKKNIVTHSNDILVWSAAVSGATTARSDEELPDETELFR
jgi:SNF2 family DNA or RNA helicase